MDQAAELVAALDLSVAQLGVRVQRVWWEQREPAVWAFVVVMGGIGAKHALGVAAADDQQAVEALGTDGADEAFGVGVACGAQIMCVSP